MLRFAELSFKQSIFTWPLIMGFLAKIHLLAFKWSFYWLDKFISYFIAREASSVFTLKSNSWNSWKLMGIKLFQRKKLKGFQPTEGVLILNCSFVNLRTAVFAGYLYHMLIFTLDFNSYENNILSCVRKATNTICKTHKLLNSRH